MDVKIGLLYQIEKWILRYLKFNIVGTIIWSINTVVFFVLFTYFGTLTWFIVAVNGGIMEFTLITYMNRTKKGNMFDSCQKRSEENE